MKKTRRFAAMVAAMALAATMVAPTMMNAGAADETSETTIPVTVVTKGSTPNEFTGVTPNKDQVDHTYTAYQIFKGEYDSDANVFNVTGIGTGVDADSLFAENSDFMKFRKDPASESVGQKITKLLAANGSATNDDKAKAAAQAISGITDDSETAQKLAKILAEYKSTGTTLTKADAEEKSKLAEGYYIVEDTYTANPANDAISRFILKVNSAENEEIEIVPKKSYPEAIKKVKENNETVMTDWANNDPTTLESKVDTDAKWNDTADYCIGDAVPFQLYGSMPATIGDYNAYYYKFTDTLATQFNQPKEVKVKVDVKEGTDIELTFKLNDENKYQIDGENYYKGRTATAESYEFGSAKAKELLDTALENDEAYSALANDAAKAGYVYNNWDTLTGADGALENATTKNVADWIKVIPAKEAINEQDRTTDGNCRVKWDNDNGVLTVEFEDIKAYAGVDKDTIVTVNYSAVLNENAVIGLNGQENKVDLTYSNSPNVEYNADTTDRAVPDILPSTDKTPEDTVVVFTYEVDVTKVDNVTEDPLAGAKFILKDKDGNMAVLDGNGKVTDWIGNATASVSTEEGNKGNVTFTGTKTSKNHADEQDYTVPDPTVIATPADGLFNIIGLDAGTYTLVELVAPEGYVLPKENEFDLVVTPKHGTDNYIAHTQQYKEKETYNEAAKVLTAITGKLGTVDMTEKSDNKHGTLEGKITNSNITELPSTGGMGTKLFIAGGGITATLAAVYLVSKKRSRKEEE